MPLEIERKFLAKNEGWRALATETIEIVQAYLVIDPKKTVRVRIEDESRAVLCLKGKTNGLSTPEFELPIPDLEMARRFVRACEDDVLTKVRYLVPIGDHVFEVDEFTGRLHGLTVIEIELQSEDEVFPRPDWLGEEVTYDPRYKNALLVRDGLPT